MYDALPPSTQDIHSENRRMRLHGPAARIQDRDFDVHNLCKNDLRIRHAYARSYNVFDPVIGMQNVQRAEYQVISWKWSEYCWARRFQPDKVRSYAADRRFFSGYIT